MKNDVPSRKGLFSAMHRWGGIYRDVEFEATPQTFIDDAWVRGLFDEKSAEVHVTVNGTMGVSPVVARSASAPYQLRVTIDGNVVEQTIKSSNHLTTQPPNHQTIKLPLAEFRPWSPEHPNLYTARVDLVESGQVVHTRLERFGVRKFEVRGKEFYLNGKPFYMTTRRPTVSRRRAAWRWPRCRHGNFSSCLSAQNHVYYAPFSFADCSSVGRARHF